MTNNEDPMAKASLSTQSEKIADPIAGTSTLPAAPIEATIEGANLQVDGEAAESFIAEKRIGERIKHLRLKKSMGLVELGRHTGLSASFLSQLETGRVVPTLRNLARISMVFSKDLSYFFEPEPQTLFRVHRAKDRVRLPQSGAADPAYYFESLGYMVPDRQLDPYFAEFLPLKKGRETRAHQHVGCEFLILLTGRLDIQHGDVTHHIEAGDAVYFDADTTHSYNCSGDHRHAAAARGADRPTHRPARGHLLEPRPHAQLGECALAPGAGSRQQHPAAGAEQPDLILYGAAGFQGVMDRRPGQDADLSLRAG
jgi:transcriptional regulator with XRE-family HTH domain